MARLKSTGAQLARAQLAAQLALGCGSFPAGGKYIARILPRGEVEEPNGGGDLEIWGFGELGILRVCGVGKKGGLF